MINFLVYWKDEDAIGVYAAADAGGAVLAAVQDAGYRDLGAARDFITDAGGDDLVILAVPVGDEAEGETK